MGYDKISAEWTPYAAAFLLSEQTVIICSLSVCHVAIDRFSK